MIKWQKVNSVISYKHDVRRDRIKELGELGLNQAQIAKETGYSYSTVKREIYAIREGLG
jgi:transposase